MFEPSMFEFVWPAAAVLLASIVFSLGTAVGRYQAQPRNRSSSQSRRPLHRHRDYVTVIDEDDDGYATAVLEVDGGVDIAFCSHDEIVNTVCVPGDALAALADELSHQACKPGGAA